MGLLSKLPGFSPSAAVHAPSARSQEAARRVGLTQAEAGEVKADDQGERGERPVDTRRKKKGAGQQGGAPSSSLSPKNRKKKKKKGDPKEEYQKLMASEQEALDSLSSHAEKLSEVKTSDARWLSCVRCQEEATPRPLIGSGEALCTSCYWSMHPEAAKRERDGEAFEEKPVVEGEECRSCLDQG